MASGDVPALEAVPPVVAEKPLNPELVVRTKSLACAETDEPACTVAGAALAVAGAVEVSGVGVGLSLGDFEPPSTPHPAAATTKVAAAPSVIAHRILRAVEGI
ncbi:MULTISPECIES: hypothetical protein [unclassified Frankia]|uniref:hypothetical protein n=1 Tax=unclassified Frankia TaxID=2632575 RepID=UPI001EE4E3BC|nr:MULTISPECIES: hypothetical protein [unclassified Frankia]